MLADVASDSDPSLISPARILIVEDERIVARDLSDAVTDLGYEVVATVATGAEAILQARAQHPDLVLMDIRLPGSIDGIEAAESIRRETDVPVVFLTAHSDIETLRRAEQTDPFGYLTKPFRASELRCTIEIALHKQKIDARLRARERWLETTLRSISDAVVATDPQQRVQLLNPAAETLTGRKQTDAMGKAIDEIMVLVDERGRARLENPLGHAIETKGVTKLPHDTLLIAANGTAVPVDDCAAAIVDDRGDVLGGVIVFRDISEQRRRLEEVRRLNAELEQRVAERTERLEAANKELEAFSYSVAHDLRGPLRNIAGFSQVLIEDHAHRLDAAGLQHLERVRMAARRMADLINDLLSLSRVRDRDFQRQRVDLSHMSSLVIAELRRAYPERSVEAAIQEGVVVQGDEHLLRILLDNLIGNAWKFTAKTPHAKIEFGSVQDSGRQVCFVRDNGAGFSMENSHKLFGAFQRLHSESDFEGTGIGLAIVQRIVKRHGGSIWAASEPGKGATFFFVV